MYQHLICLDRGGKHGKILFLYSFVEDDVGEG